MLTVKFFQVNDRYYAKARHDGNVVDTQAFYNVMDAYDYIKAVMTWGYSRSEITFMIDPTCGKFEAEDIRRAIDIYAD